jgi:hypothetical protein
MTQKRLPQADMFNLIAGRWVSHIIYIAAKLELADRLSDGPLAVEELALAAGVQAPPLYRVLRALASFGVFAETRPRHFKLTPLAVTLQKSVPGSMHAAALMFGAKYLQEAWEKLFYGLKSSEIPFLEAHGVSVFEYLEKHTEDLKLFGETMTSVSSMENPAIAAAFKSSGIRTVVDIGGGNGSLLATILKANPKMRGVLFDQPSVIARARQHQYVTAKDIAERCALESGDFFEAVPKGGDAYMMKRTLHDWDDERCAKILANCRAAMGEKGKVLVVDAVIAPGNSPDRGKLMDVQMLIIGGRERSRPEFAKVFRDAGLKLTRVIPTKCPLSIVEGIRA